MDFVKKNIFIIIALILTFFAYSNIFHNSFISDDQSFIITWSEPKNLQQNIGSLLKGNLPTGQEGVYRPLRSIFYGISYLLWGAEPKGYHFQSILVHLIITLIIYFISKEILENKLTASISALVFGLHPAHVEAITWITASMDTIGFIFFFGSFYTYILSSKHNNNYFLYISLFLYFLSSFHYELTTTLPAIIFSYEYFIQRKSLNKSLTKSLGYFSIFVTYLIIRFSIASIPTRAGYIQNSKILTWIIMIPAIAKYIILTLFPYKLHYNHEIINGIKGLYHFEFTPEKNIQFPSIFSPLVLASLISLIILIYFSIKLKKKYSITGFSLFFFLLSLTPTLQIFPTSSLFSERYLYPGIFSLSLLIGSAFHYLYSSKSKFKKYISIIVITMLSIYYINTTYQRNTHWFSSIRFWSYELQFDPKSSYANSELGTAYSKNGNFEKARYHTQIAIQSNPYSPVNISNLAYINLVEKDYQQAIILYKRAIELNPNLHDAYIGLAEALAKNNQQELAIDIYLDLINRQPNYVESYINLSALFLEDKPQKALQTIIQAQDIAPDRPEIHKALGYIYQKLDQPEKSKQHLLFYLKLNPQDQSARNLLNSL